MKKILGKVGMVRISFIVLLTVLVGCATFGISLDTPEKKYLAARTELNLLLEQYLEIQDGVPDGVHEKTKTAFHAADIALDNWGYGLDDPDYNYITDMNIWLRFKSEIISVIRSY